MIKQRGQFSSRWGIVILACAAALLAQTLSAADEAPASTQGASTLSVTTRIGKIRGDKTALEAMTRGAKFLLAQQKNANWERQPKRGNETHDGGETALVLWTLLHVGECLDDESLRADSPQLKEAVAGLLQIQPKTTYVAAMQALAISKLPLTGNPDATKAAERARNYLLSAIHSDGGFGYTAPGKGKGNGDNANAATANQGLAALQLEGIETPGSIWTLVDEYWHAAQRKDGGWSYDEGSRRNSTSGMTAAAVASLHYTAAFRENKISATLPAGETLKTPPNGRDVALANGLTYLGAEFQPASRDYYFLYHLQRAIGGAGLSTLARKDVIAATADAIAKAQKPDGSWQAEFADPTISGDQSLVSTCYAMLTLAEGFEPIAFSKLDYGIGWDERPRDVANLTMWMSSKLPTPMRWQVISEMTPEPNDFASPVVIISGAKDFRLSAAMTARLRSFSRAGGMIVSIEEKPAEPEKEKRAATEKEKKEKEGKKSATLPATRPTTFTESITMNIAKEVFLQEYKFRALPAGHPLGELWGKVNTAQILAASNGVRELWVHIPFDAGASWQSRNFQDKESFNLATNIYSYATGKGEMLSLELPTTVSTTAPATQQRAVSIARVMAGVNADPEPKAWQQFAPEAEKLFRTRAVALPSRTQDLDAARMPIAHWVIASEDGKLTKAEIEQIAAYVAKGGLLVVEAAGGNVEYAEAARQMLGKIFPNDKLELIPRNDLLYNGAMKDSAKIKEAQYRRYAATTRPMESAPRLRGIARGGRWTVVFSEDDLSAGLLGINTWGISGYSVRDSRRLMGNLILYSLKPVVPASTEPAP